MGGLYQRIKMVQSTSPSTYSNGVSYWFKKKEFQKMFGCSHDSVNVKLPGITLKVSSVDGNLVNLEWGPKPWEDKVNDFMMKLLELDSLLVQNFTLIFQYA